MTRISLSETAHHLIRPHLPMGGCAIDATVGNGHDTLFLAQSVGGQGRVYGFDIQAQALETTHERLQQHGVAERVFLMQASHAEMAEHIPFNVHGSIQAIMFNLGYLPGGDKTVITRLDSTLLALQAASQLLAVDGILTVLAYPGHEGGAQEAGRVTEWCLQLDQPFAVEIVNSNRPAPQAPRLFAIRKCA